MYSILHRLSRIMAWLGGVMLSALIVMTCLSILGRGLNDMLHSDAGRAVSETAARWLLDTGVGAINGDYELVEAGIAFAIFSFLPLCQIREAHASVDIFTERMPDRLTRPLRAAISALFAIVLAVIAVQLFAGMTGKKGSGQLSFLLQFPVWWGYAICLPGATLAALVAIYQAVLRGAEATTGRALLPDTGPPR